MMLKNRLKELRKEKGLSQEMLAAQLDMTRGQIADYESVPGRIRAFRPVS